MFRVHYYLWGVGYQHMDVHASSAYMAESYVYELLSGEPVEVCSVEGVED